MHISINMYCKTLVAKFRSDLHHHQLIRNIQTTKLTNHMHSKSARGSGVVGEVESEPHCMVSFINYSFDIDRI